MLVGKLPSDNN